MALRTDPRRYVSQLWARLTDSAREAVQDLAQLTAAGFADVHRDLLSLDGRLMAGCFRATLASSPSLSSGITTLAFSVKERDDTGEYTTMFEPKEAGTWLISAGVFLTGRADGNASRLELWKNGAMEAIIDADIVGAAGNGMLTCAVPVEVVKGDYFKLGVRTSGSCTANHLESYFAGLRVR